MTKKAFKQADSADKKISKQQWELLVKILEENYTIKTKNKDAIFLKIPNEGKADIEIFLSGSPAVHTFHVQLWYFDLPENYQHLQVAHLDTIRSVIMQVDNILDIVRSIKKLLV